MIKKSVFLLVAASLALAVAPAAAQQATPRVEAGAKSGGTLRIAVPRWPGYGLLVHNNHWQGFYLNQYESLVKTDDKENYYPWLAKSWEVAEDGLSYRFKLREDVTFQDGERFNASAVKSTFDGLLIDKLLNTGSPVSLGVGNLKSVDVIDEFTVEFKLSAPNALFLNTLSTPASSIVSPKAFKKENAKLINQQGGLLVKGTGPYDLVSIIPDKQMVFKRFDKYNWAPATARHDGPAYIETVIFDFVRDPAVRSGLLASGQVDAIIDVSINDIPLFRDSPKFTYVERYGTRAPLIYYFNEKGFATDDVRVRDAFREALDIDALVAAIYQGAGRRVWSQISPASRFYNPRFEGKYTNNVKRANALLDEAGWTGRNREGVRTNQKGEPLQLVLLDRGFEGRTKLLTEAIQQTLLEKVGIKLTIDSVDIAQGFAKREQNKYSVFHNQVSGTDPGHGLNISWRNTGTVNFSQTKDDKLDSWVKGQSEAVTAEERQKYFDLIENYILLEKRYALPLVLPAETTAGLKRVRNLDTTFVPQRANPGPVAYDLWLDK